MRAAAGGRPLLIDWEIGSATGWGVFGLNLARHALQSGRAMPVPLMRPARISSSAAQAPLVARLAETHRAFHPLVSRSGASASFRSPVLRALGNGLAGNPHAPPVVGSRAIGLVFFEDARLDRQVVERGREFDLIVAGSTWNADLLRRAGVHDVEFCMQGVDPSIFHPAPRGGWFWDRFVVFSGGKLEFRKGQDIVVAAFREFHRRHPEALLIVAWHNFWPGTATEIAAGGHVDGVPEPRDDGTLDVVGWLERNGVPRTAVLDAGLVSQPVAAQLVREADVAVFPNRAEGGTNLVAMECMAAGVPTVLSSNTGHLDVADPDRCFVLERQLPVTPTAKFPGTEGWGESSVDELVAAMEEVRASPAAARKRGDAAARFMLERSWTRQSDQLLDLVLAEP
jgi:glycosyltransferase involved in cell wall biosynthesis